MECTCPRCLYSFFPEIKKAEPAVDKPKDIVYSHDCTSGYWRPYPQFMCKECGPDNSDTELMSLSRISEINKERKEQRFRERDEDSIFEAELESEGARIG